MKEQSLRLYRLTFLQRVPNILPMCPQVLEFGFDLWFSWKTCKSRNNITHWLSAWDSPVCCSLQWVHKISWGLETRQNDVYFEQKYTIILFIKQKALFCRKTQLMVFLQRNTATGIPVHLWEDSTFSSSYPPLPAPHPSFNTFSCSVSGMHGKGHAVQNEKNNIL